MVSPKRGCLPGTGKTPNFAGLASAEVSVDDEMATATERQSVPVWYWVVSIGALLFESLGCYFYLEEVRLTPEQIALLPLDQAAMLSARPGWYYAAFATAVWVGLAGTIGLLLRRRWAETLLLISLVAVIVQFSAIFIVPGMRVVTSDALLGPIIVIGVCYAILMFARLAKKRGWLH